MDKDSGGALWLLVHTYTALLGRIELLDFAVFGERIRLSKAEKMMFIAKARFGRHTEENILEKRDRDRRRAGGTGGRRRAGRIPPGRTAVPTTSISRWPRHLPPCARRRARPQFAHPHPPKAAPP